MAIKIILLVVFFSIMVGVGLYCRRSAVNVDGFVLGSRSVGPWLTAFAYGTTYFSAVIFVGYAGQFGWRFGISSTWIGIGNALLGSLLAWVVLGRRTCVMTHYLGSATMPQFFGQRFGSPALKIGAALIIFIFLIPYTASLYNGLSRLFGMAFNIDYSVCIIVMALLTCVYVVVGGYMATAVNDFIQGIIMLAGIVAVIAAVLNGHGGFMESLNGLAAVQDATVSESPGVFASFFGPNPLNLLGVIILTSLGTWGLPQMVQKFYAIKSEKAIDKGAIVSTIFAIVIAGGCYFLGGFGRLYDIDVSKVGYDAIIPTMLSGLSPMLIGIVVILVLSASMSTLSSLVLTSCSTVTLDLIKGNIIKNMSEKKQLLYIRILLVIFIAISVIIAIVQFRYKITFIAQLMGLSWGTLAGSFLAPFLYGLYWKRVTKVACWTSFLFATSVMISNTFFPSAFPEILRSPINCGAFVMLAGLIVVPVVSLITRPPDAALVNSTFACYEEKVKVPARKSLGEHSLAD